MPNSRIALTTSRNRLLKGPHCDEETLDFGYRSDGPVGRDAVAQWVDAVKAGKMFFPPTVKQLLGRPGHSFDDYLRANAATLNT